MHILSIQSWVAAGHVGNAAAVFPLQRLGAAVSAIHTVQFSNHPGHGAHTGRAYPADETRALIDGLAAHGTLATIDAILSGYIGDPATGDAILHAVALTPQALYACDPVIGDDGREYVSPGVAGFFRARAVPRADILTPNQFELATLTGLPCGTRAEAERAAAALRDRLHGPAILLVTSLIVAETPADALDLLVAAADGTRWLRVPRLAARFRGAGDVMSALFLFHVLSSLSPLAAAARAASSLHGLLRLTDERGSPELLLVEAQAALVAPTDAVAITPQARR